MRTARASGIFLVLSLLLAGSPLAAQGNGSATPPAAQPRNGVGQLDDMLKEMNAHVNPDQPPPDAPPCTADNLKTLYAVLGQVDGTIKSTRNSLDEVSRQVGELHTRISDPKTRSQILGDYRSGRMREQIKKLELAVQEQQVKTAAGMKELRDTWKSCKVSADQQKVVPLDQKYQDLLGACRKLEAGIGQVRQKLHDFVKAMEKLTNPSRG